MTSRGVILTVTRVGGSTNPPILRMVPGWKMEEVVNTLGHIQGITFGMPQWSTMSTGDLSTDLEIETDHWA